MLAVTDVKSFVITDIIELGLPFTDPIGDGPTIQASNNVSKKAALSISLRMHLYKCWQYCKATAKKNKKTGGGAVWIHAEP